MHTSAPFAARRQNRLTAALLACCFLVFSVGALPLSLLNAEYLPVEPAGSPVTEICETYVDAFSIDISADVFMTSMRLAPDVHVLFQPVSGERPSAADAVIRSAGRTVQKTVPARTTSCDAQSLFSVLRI